MSIKRIQAIIMRHLYLYKGRSLPRFMDILFWPVMTILSWGFLSVYLNKINLSNLNFISVILGAVILWEVVQRSQQSVSISFLEDVWEKNFLNIFISPLTLGEFFVATLFLGVIKIILTCAVLFVISLALYHYNLFSLGLSLVPYVANLFLFGVVVALFINSIILRFGTSAQVLAFGVIFIMQPVSAVYYPVSVLPTWIQPVSYSIPVTHVFESMRKTIAGEPFDMRSFLIALGLNLLYLSLAWIFFTQMFKSVKKKGLLLKVQN
jgi:ABC-2 type transport system permease protein